ncbi:22600_t:CDS:2 [Entrophospora sp. SA101]|nr:22600_t:CDS:2 [Entrophospora sp. SA101]
MDASPSTETTRPIAAARSRASRGVKRSGGINSATTQQAITTIRSSPRTTRKTIHYPNNIVNKHFVDNNGRDSLRRHTTTNTNTTHKRKMNNEESIIPVASSSKSNNSLTDEDENATNRNRRSLRIKLRSEAKIQSSIENQESSSTVRGESSNRKSNSNNNDDNENDGSADYSEEGTHNVTTALNGDKEEIKELKRKLDDSENALNDNNQPISKRRAIWAGIGATIGAGVAAITLNSTGITETVLSYFN